MLREKRWTPIRRARTEEPPANALRSAITEFLRWTIAVGLSPETERIRKAALERFSHWSESAGVEDPKGISLSLLEGYQHHLATSRKANGTPLAHSTQATRLNPVVAFCRWLARQGKVEADPSLRLVLPRQVRRLPARVPTQHEVGAMLCTPDTSTLSGIRDRAILELFYCTGLRRMELARLTLANVDLAAESLHVRCGKGRRDRVVPLAPRSAGWLRNYLERVRPRLVADAETGVVFLTDYGEPFAKNRMGELVKRYVSKSGFPAAGSCHLLRHACATHMLDNGADIRFIQTLLGHADLSTTQIYTHVSIEKLREVHARSHPLNRGSEMSLHA